MRRSAAMAGGLVLATAGLGAGAQAPAPPSDAPAAPATKLVPRPLWELGAGIGVVSLPDYVGSNQSRTYVLPVPYVEYRGEWLKADRDGARAFLIRDERVNVQLSAAAAVPANSRDNEARRGMPDLPPTVELGPNVEIHLARRAGAHDPRIDLRLPLRAAFTVEHQPRSVGFTFSPHVNLDLRELAGGWNLGLLTGPMFASERYHQLYYGVDPVFATPQRPAYQARAGYAGWRALAATSRRFGRTWVGAFARVDDVHGAVFESSPLVRRRNNFSAGIAVAWVFAASATLVPSED